MKIDWRYELPQLAVLAAMFVAAAVCWPLVPERLPVHWNLAGEVDRWALPNIIAIKLVLKGALQGGGARNLRLDNLGKAMAGALLRMEIEVTQAELDQTLSAPRVGWWPE